MKTRLLPILLLACCSTVASAQRLSLFSPETKAVVPRTHLVVMDFLERYFVDINTQQHTTIERKMMDDKVYFRKGAISDLQHLCDTVPFYISLVDNRYYEVAWLHDDEPFVTVVFPAQYDLLFGMNQDEAGHHLKDSIMAARPAQREDSVPGRDTLEALPEEGVYKLQTDTFYLASLSDATYYNNNVEPVFDAIHAEYSAANLFQGLFPDADYRMYVEQGVYGMSTISYTITLRQWLNYCAEWGLKVYFAIEEQREDGLLALIIARSTELGFNHMLSVVIPDKLFAEPSGSDAVLKVRLNPYIPTHNLRNLYQQQTTNRKKIKWQ